MIAKGNPEEKFPGAVSEAIHMFPNTGFRLTSAGVDKKRSDEGGNSTSDPENRETSSPVHAQHGEAHIWEGTSAEGGCRSSAPHTHTVASCGSRSVLYGYRTQLCGLPLADCRAKCSRKGARLEL